MVLIPIFALIVVALIFRRLPRFLIVLLVAIPLLIGFFSVASGVVDANNRLARPGSHTYPAAVATRR
jgi:hypothetical protein